MKRLFGFLQMEKSQPKALLSEDCSWTESQGMMLEPGSGVWQENALPESAAQVFSPTSKNTEAFWEREEERRPFLEQRFYQEEWPEDASPKGAFVQSFKNTSFLSSPSFVSNVCLFQDVAALTGWA